MLHIKALAGAGVAMAALVVAATGCGSNGKVAYKVESATGDVKVTQCAAGSSGIPVAQLKVSNHASYAADYVILVEFTSGATKLTSGPAFSGGVPAGKSVAGSAVGGRALPAGSPVTCAIQSVKRNPADPATAK